VPDARRFLDEAGPLLLADEARHNLLVSIGQALVDVPETYPEHHLFMVVDDGDVVQAAGLTPPFHLVISRPSVAGAETALAEFLHREGLAIPGVIGALPEVEGFAGAWARVAGVTAEIGMAQRIYSCAAVRPVEGAPGRTRTATEDDRDLVTRWVRAFAREALQEDGERMDRTVELRLRGRGGSFVLWEDDGPVSITGYGSWTPNGVRIGPVYTPPELRGRGYASALVASVSAELLAGGRRLCFLYTDLANPTSNRVYTRIGYEPVCDSREIAFVPRDR
jgi:uncharacterized protein